MVDYSFMDYSKDLRVFDSSCFSRTKTTTDDSIVKTIKNVILLELLLTSVYLASLYLDTTQKIHGQIEQFYFASLVVFVAIVIADVFTLVLHEVNRRKYLRSTGAVHSAVPFLSNVAKIGIYSFATLVVLKMYRIDITPAIASAGVLGVAVAFAAKDFVANLFGGISVFFDKPYSVGDYVIIKELYRGEVMEIGMRSTKIRTRDNVLLTVPNSVMVTDTIVNETGYEPFLRVRIPIQISYDSDYEAVEKVLVDIAMQHPEIIKSPEPRVRFRSLEDSGVNLELLVVIKQPSEKGNAVHQILKMILKEFRERGIQIPYPHRQVIVHQGKPVDHV